MLHDGLMQGKVHHVRLHPRKHDFSYASSMVLLDTEKLESNPSSNFLNKSKFWSLNRFNLVSLYRNDYIGGHKESVLTINEEVKQLIYKRTGKEFDGKVKLLSHPRQWGFVFNPVSFYFCYAASGELQWIISEINNTPWNERHAYLHNISEQTRKDKHDYQFVFDKCFHVSPFMPMDLKYEWRFFFNGDDIRIVMKLFKHNELQFTAGLNLEWQPFSSRSMYMLPVLFPLQTFLIVYRIYWNAFLLHLKKIPFYTHPDKLSDEVVQTTESMKTERS